MEEKLQFILLQSIDWLKFAEAKNGVIIAGTSAAIIGVSNLLICENILLKIYSIQLIIQLFIALIICLISFLPTLRKPKNFNNDSPSGKENPFFFGDIAKFNPNDYLKYFYKKLGKRFTSKRSTELFLSDEIVINSRIAMKKYSYFNFSLWILISGLITPILVIPTLMIIKKIIK